MNVGKTAEHDQEERPGGGGGDNRQRRRIILSLFSHTSACISVCLASLDVSSPRRTSHFL